MTEDAGQNATGRDSLPKLPTKARGAPIPEVPWDRQVGESAHAYAAFLAYRDYGDDRSLAKVAAKLGKKTHNLERLSSRWKWQDRLAYSTALCSAVAACARCVASRWISWPNTSPRSWSSGSSW